MSVSKENLAARYGEEVGNKLFSDLTENLPAHGGETHLIDGFLDLQAKGVARELGVPLEIHGEQSQVSGEQLQSIFDALKAPLRAGS